MQFSELEEMLCHYLKEQEKCSFQMKWLKLKNWISDEDLARIFFKIDPTTLLNFELQRKQNVSEDDSIKYDEGVAGKYPDYGSMEAAA